eukprot:TRINITY_DN4147_c0_g1_i1.p1 TRINITY_DN4147_c0_g1~~TRINITY_DN4147_c0_g1_i1.p1  ORF type:complete len:344 (-),score=63.17 TRINITY_DN4147_c0_g1_i1:30-1061(-)
MDRGSSFKSDYSESSYDEEKSYRTFSKNSINISKENTKFQRNMLMLQNKLGIITFVINCILLFVFYLILFYGFFIQLFVLPEFVQVLYILMPVCLILFSFCHSMYSLGWQFSLIFLALTVILSYLFELFGVQTGVLYGKYSYTDLIPLQIFSVPLEIPFSWYMMLYPCFCVADNIVSGASHKRKAEQMITSKGTMVASRISLAVLTALIMIGWDLGADPLGSTLSSIWKWKSDDGFYFGVPLLNFFGWLITCFVIIFLYLLLEYFIPIRRISPMASGFAAHAYSSLPLIAYLGMTLFYVIQSIPSEVCLITAFSMGLPFVIAVIRLLLVGISERANVIQFLED